MAPPAAFNELLAVLEEADISHHVLIPDVESLVEQERQARLQQGNCHN